MNGGTKALLEVVGVILAMILIGWVSINVFGSAHSTLQDSSPDYQCAYC